MDLEQKLQTTLEAPVFSKYPLNKLSGEEIVAQVRPILRKRMAETNYDRIAIARRFLQHFCQEKSKKPTAPLEALSSFFVKSDLFDNGNSCVGLSLDLLSYLPSHIKGYPVASILAKHYQQFAGPLYSHVALSIAFRNPDQEDDQGFVLLDPSFHIAEPILVRRKGPSFLVDMGEKKGIWAFSLEGERIFCRAGPRPGEAPWSREKIEEATMIYRTDCFLNPEKGYAIHQLPIDRSYPLVSRHENGEQKAHVNIDFRKEEVSWKMGHQKKDPIPFQNIREGTFSFVDELYPLLRFPKEKFLGFITEIVKNKDVFDALYRDYLLLLKKSPHFARHLRYPEEIQDSERV